MWEGDEEQTWGKERKVKKVKTLEGREGRCGGREDIRVAEQKPERRGLARK